MLNLSTFIEESYASFNFIFIMVFSNELMQQQQEENSYFLVFEMV